MKPPIGKPTMATIQRSSKDRPDPLSARTPGVIDMV
jgi:hypothetical protein